MFQCHPKVQHLQVQSREINGSYAIFFRCFDLLRIHYLGVGYSPLRQIMVFVVGVYGLERKIATCVVT